VSPEAAWQTILDDLLRHRCRRATIRQHRHIWFAFCGFLGPRRRLTRVTERDLDRFLARPARGHHSNGRALEVSTQHTYACVVKGAYRRLHAAGVLRTNPLANYIPPPVEEGPPRDLDSSTVGDLLAAASGDERDMAVVLLAWGVGLRIGSIARARIEHVDLRGDGALFVKGKGGRNGQVPLAPPVAAFLRAYLDGRPRSGPLIDNRGLGDAGQHLCPDQVGKLLRRLLREVGSNARPHDLRHTFATTLLAARHGEGLRAVSRLMLHSSVRSTERYVGGFDADSVATVALLPDPRALRSPYSA
jgi:integrase